MNHVIHRYAKANNRYIKDYDPSTESSYFMYWDVNNLYEWLLSQKLPVDGFKQRNDKFNFYEDFIQSYDENSDKAWILEVDAEYPKELKKSHNDLRFLL